MMKTASDVLWRVIWEKDGREIYADLVTLQAARYEAEIQNRHGRVATIVQVLPDAYPVASVVS